MVMANDSKPEMPVDTGIIQVALAVTAFAFVIKDRAPHVAFIIYYMGAGGSLFFYGAYIVVWMQEHLKSMKPLESVILVAHVLTFMAVAAIVGTLSFYDFKIP